MNFLLLLIVSLIINHSSEEKHEWVDANVNSLGVGYDALSSNLRQSVLELYSIIPRDQKLPIIVKDLPQGIIAIATPTDKFRLDSKIVSHNENIKDSKSISVDGKAKFWKIAGSFSYESKYTKQQITNTQNNVAIVTASVSLYKMFTQASSMNISKGFNYQVRLIDSLLQKNTNQTFQYAKAAVDELILYFGTHVIYEIELGGSIRKMDTLDTSKFTTNVEQSMSASASASFASYFSINGKITTAHTDMNSYSQALISTDILTNGGAPWKENSTFDTWTDSLEVNPAIISASATYIRDFVSNLYFSNITYDRLNRIRALIDERMEVYLDNNYYLGCNDPASTEYVWYSNAFDPSLCKYDFTFHFGGLFTTSSDPNFVVPNTLTETTSCPEGYDTNLLFSQTISIFKSRYCASMWEQEWDGWIVYDYNYCVYQYYQIETDTYSCTSQKNQTVGMFFGGATGLGYINDLTGSISCPSKYTGFPIYFSADKSAVVWICMAPYDIGHVAVIPFGGIFSSEMPNFLNNKIFGCAGGFERHTVGGGTVPIISFCIKLGSLNYEDKDIIPPGYGNSGTYQDDIFELISFPNGSKIGIKLNPLSPDSYKVQMLNMANKIATVGLNNTDFISTHLQNEASPIYHIVNWVKLNIPTHLNPFNKNQPQQSPLTVADKVGLGLGIPIGTIVIATIIVIGIIYHNKIKEKFRRLKRTEYIPI